MTYTANLYSILINIYFIVTGIIKIVTAMTMHCTTMWWPNDTLGGKINSAIFVGFSGLTIYNFLSSMYHGPGYLQFKWKPVSHQLLNNYILNKDLFFRKI